MPCVGVVCLARGRSGARKKPRRGKKTKSQGSAMSTANRTTTTGKQPSAGAGAWRRDPKKRLEPECAASVGLDTDLMVVDRHSRHTYIVKKRSGGSMVALRRRPAASGHFIQVRSLAYQKPGQGGTRLWFP